MDWLLLAIVGAGLWWWHRRSHADATMPRIRGTGDFGVEVVGESFYRAALLDLFPVREHAGEEVAAVATLEFDDQNPHDDQAVRVAIRGRQVGHLSRAMARDFRAAIERDRLTKWRVFLVDARVWVPDDAKDHYSARVDLPQA